MSFVKEYERRKKLLAACEERLSNCTCPMQVIVLENWVINHKTWLEQNEAKYGAYNEFRRTVEGTTGSD